MYTGHVASPGAVAGSSSIVSTPSSLIPLHKDTKHPAEYYTVYTLTVYLAFNIMVHCCILFSGYIFCGARGERAARLVLASPVATCRALP